MSEELAQLKAQLDRIEVMQDSILRQLNERRRPHLTIRQFAKESGFSERHIHRLVASHRISKRKGRIPASELEKFTSQPNHP